MARSGCALVVQPHLWKRGGEREVGFALVPLLPWGRDWGGLAPRHEVAGALRPWGG